MSVAAVVIILMPLWVDHWKRKQAATPDQLLPLGKGGYGMTPTNDNTGGTYFYTTNAFKGRSPFREGFDMGFEAGVQSAIQAHIRFLKHAETLGDNPPIMINVELWRDWSLSIWTNRIGVERTK